MMPVNTGYVNAWNLVFTVLVGLAVLAVVHALHTNLRRWAEAQIEQLAASLKHELPPLLVGEMMTHEEMRHFQDRLLNIEAEVSNVKRRIAVLGRDDDRC